jgi:oligopeptidase A
VLDATDAWSEAITDESKLAGIPESGRAVLRAYAEEKRADGWLVTLKQPSVQAVLSYADDRALRERVYRAYQTRASDQGPNANEFDNSARIENILALRHEAAQLLGFRDAAEESLATKMAPSSDAVLAFLHDLAARASPSRCANSTSCARSRATNSACPTCKPGTCRTRRKNCARGNTRSTRRNSNRTSRSTP